MRGAGGLATFAGKIGIETVLRAIALSGATLRKMHQNLFYPLVISPEVAALSMSGSSVLAAVNALLLKRTKLGGTK